MGIKKTNAMVDFNTEMAEACGQPNLPADASPEEIAQYVADKVAHKFVGMKASEINASMAETYLQSILQDLVDRTIIYGTAAIITTYDPATRVMLFEDVETYRKRTGHDPADR